MQALLEDRFKLRIHREAREIPVFALTVAKGGPKLTPFREGSCVPLVITFPPTPQPLGPGETRCVFLGGLSGPHMVLDAQGITLEQFSAFFLLGASGRPIIDKTGLTRKFDLHLEYAPPPVDPAHRALAELQAAAGEPTAPEIFTAIQEQLGLKLEPAKGPGEFLVIDHALGGLTVPSPADRLQQYCERVRAKQPASSPNLISSTRTKYFTARQIWNFFAAQLNTG